MLTSTILGFWVETLKPYVPRSVGHVMYNDESPAGQVEFYRAHAKGVLAFGAAQPLRTSGIKNGSSHGVESRTATGKGGQEEVSQKLRRSWAATTQQQSGSWATGWLLKRKGTASSTGPQQVRPPSTPAATRRTTKPEPEMSAAGSHKGTGRASVHPEWQNFR